jgi:1-acyl-sn-glycerol-3-phosphate acyltransferase
MIHPILFKLADSKIRYKVIKNNEYSGKTAEFSEDRPLIFVCNHSNSCDIPIALQAIKEHTILFAGKQPLEKVDELFFNLNGTIYVDRKNREDMALSKEAMVETLNKKRNILVFPEGTWNLEDGQLMHEMKWGIIDVAREANALIVPLALNYDYEKNTCEPQFGEPIDVKYVSNITSINEVRDSIASMRYKFFERKGLFKRKDIDVEKEKEVFKKLVEAYPKLDYEYEKSVIYHRKPTEEEVFAPIKKLNK